MRLFLSSLLLAACLAAPAQAADNARAADVAAIKQIVEQFKAAIIAHDGKTLDSLFLQGHDSWLTVADDQTWADVKARNPNARKWFAGARRQFTDFVQNEAKPVEERFYNVRIDTNGAVASVWFDFDFLEDGKVTNRGLEIEVGNTPINGWSFYGSLGFNKSEIKDDMRQNGTAFLPTAGKEMINTPRRKAGLSVEYQQASFYSRLKMRSNSRQAASMVNDEWAPGYTVFDIDGGYTFANFGWLKRPKLSWNISNIFSKEYRNASSVSITNTNPVPGVTTSVGTQRYYLGAPRFASVTLSVDI